MYSVYGQYKTAISQLWDGYSFVYLVYGKRTANTQLWVGYSFIYSVYVRVVQVAGFALRAKFFAMHSRGFVWKNDRRCIGDASPNVRRCIPQLSSINCISRNMHEASAIHRRCIAEVSVMIRGCIPEYSLDTSGASGFLRLCALHTCVDTRIEKTCQLLHRRCIFPSGDVADASPMHRRSIPRSIPEHFLAALRCPLMSIGSANLSNGIEAFIRGLVRSRGCFCSEITGQIASLK